MSLKSFIKKVAKYVAPVVAIFYPPAAIAIGEFLGFTGATAVAAGSAAISAGSALASGASPEDALKAGVAGAAAGGAGASAAELGRVGASAVAGAAGGGTSAALSGQDVAQGALRGAVTSAATTGLTEGAKDIYAAGQQYAASQPGYVPPVDYSIAPPPTGGGQGLKASVDTSPGYNLAVTSGEPGIKATPSTSGYELVKPSPTEGEPTLKAGPSTGAFTAPSPLSDTLAKGVGKSLASMLVDGSGGVPLASSSYLGAPAPTGGATTGTTVGLTGERGAGEIESKETGKQRKNVWNEASLRLKDALGV